MSMPKTMDNTDGADSDEFKIKTEVLDIKEEAVDPLDELMAEDDPETMDNSEGADSAEFQISNLRNGLWTVDEHKALIMFVRDRRELYDQSLPGYSNRDRIEHLWNEVSRDVKTKNAKQCRTKWQVLRGSYRSRKNDYVPFGSVKNKKKKWPYFESLTFLSPYITERKLSSNLGICEEQSQVIEHVGSPPQEDNFDFFQEDVIDCEVEMLPDDQSRPSTSQSTARPKWKQTTTSEPEQGLNEVMRTYFQKKTTAAATAEGLSSMQLFLKNVGIMCDQHLDTKKQIQLQITILQEVQKLMNYV